MVLNLVIKALAAVVALVFASAVGAAIVPLWRFLVKQQGAAITSAAPLLSTVAISSGVLIAILTFSRDRERLAREREEGRSKVFLEQAQAGLDEAYELLKDQNNKRIIWVRAARVLLEARELGRQIKAPEYEKAYRLYEDRMRSELFRALTRYNPKTGEREPLPPPFFYGLDNWDRPISLDDAAREASAEIKVSSVTIDANVSEPGLRPLAPKSVVAIFDFLEYPPDYHDLLVQVEVWNDHWEHSHGPSQGAKRFVAHEKATTAVAGKLHKHNEGG